MSAMSLRLPDDVDARLTEEARLEGRPRSEVVREAIVDYLARRERERFMREMVAAAEALASDPDSRQEMLEIAEITVDDGLATIAAEETATDAGHNERWWR